MLRWLIIDPTLPMSNKNSQEVIGDQIRATFDHDTYVHWQHSKNIQIHDQSYKSAFNRIMMSNPCNIIINKNDKDKTEKIVQCGKIMDGVVS